MSTFKKVISIVLCLTMVFGTFAVAGDLFVPKASATVGESRIPTFAQLKETYGDDFVYYGIDVMEYDADNNPYYTDHYVQPGDKLQIQHTVKMTRYMGVGTSHLMFDAAFFDLTMGTGTMPSSLDVKMNPDHVANKTDSSITGARGMTAKYTGKEEEKNGNLIDYCGYTQEELDAIHKIGMTLAKDTTVSLAVIPMQQDTYFGSYDVMVREGLTEGTTGKIHQDTRYWKATTTASNKARAISDITNTPLTITDPEANSTSAKASNQSGIAADKFITDTLHVFTIGENPEAGSGEGGSTVGESRIPTFAKLKETYGDDFVYYGIDVMEYDADNNPYYTDHYVQPGDKLQIQHTVKMTRYMGVGTSHLMFDAAFFDLTMGTGTMPSSLDVKMNPDHVANKTDSSITGARGMTAKYTGKEEEKNGNLIDYCGYTQEELDAIHKIGMTLAKDTTVSLAVIPMQQDTYFGSYDVMVREGLTEGTTGKIHQDTRYWKATTTASNKARALSDITNTPLTVTDPEAPSTNAKASNVSGIAADKFITDTLHVFTIGENPNAGGTVSKPSAIFVENDGTQISKKQYDEGAAVEIPAAIDGQIGWANVADGEGKVIEDLTGYTMPKKTVTFKRVLSTDEFEITLNVNGGELDTANLPEGVTANEDGTLSIKACIGEKVSFANIAPTKTGYTGKWNPEEITLDNINGATAKIEWTANTYNVKFYAEKGDESSVTTVQVAYGSRITNAPTVTKEGFNFINWKSVADDSVLNTKATYSLTEDSAYYAEWSECDSSFTFMVMDYSTGEWKTLKNFYGNKGETLAKKELDSIRSGLKGETIGWDGSFRTEAAFVFSTEIGSGFFSSKALTFDGQQTIYVNTKISLDVEWDIPVYDEASDSYGDTLKTVNATVEMALNGTSTLATISSAEYAPEIGFTLSAWNNADGEAVSNYAASSNGLNFTVKSTDGAVQKYVAVYTDAEYAVAFAIGDTFATTYTLKNKVSKGDTIDLATIEVVDAKGNAATLPVIGEVSNQYDGKQGNKLLGWKIYGTGEVSFPVEITKEFIEASFLNDKFTFNANWQAQAYDATFKYETANGTEESFVIPGITVGTNFDNFAPNEERIALINANAPEGKVFSYWGNNGPMTSGGRVYTAVYDSIKYNVYIDYGFEKAEGAPLYNEVWEKKVSYGEQADEGLLGLVKGINWGGERSPAPNTLPTGWEAFHLDADSKLDDDSTWKSGINAEGSNTIKSDLVFRASWRTYKQFFFRVTDTAGAEYCALGKNFKLYYFANGRSCTRDMATLNPTNSTIVILFKPVFENGSLRLDPISVPKSMFTIGGMTGIFRAIVDAIVNAIKGV